MPDIYLDHAATTTMYPHVWEAMRPFVMEQYGNPSSVHKWGRQAKAAIDRAREQIARGIGALPTEITFTSGGTESDNLALIGLAMANRDKGNHIITSAIEHHAILHTCAFLETVGFQVTYLAPRPDGIIDPQTVQNAIQPDTILVSIMYVNNETGAIQPIQHIASICAQHQIPLHTDAVQAAGILPIAVQELGVAALSLSSHKIHGPKGIGALYVKNGYKWSPLLHGGTQERKKRAGTENVAAIVGMAAAFTYSREHRTEHAAHIQQVRNHFLSALHSEKVEFILNTPENPNHQNFERSVPSIVSILFPGVSAESLLMNLDLIGIAAASGSACTSGSLQPSHVLLAMGINEKNVKSSVRFSFSDQTTIEDVTEVAMQVGKIVRRLRVSL